MALQESNIKKIKLQIEIRFEQFHSDYRMKLLNYISRDEMNILAGFKLPILKINCSVSGIRELFLI
jgi:hypothetical protein